MGRMYQKMALCGGEGGSEWDDGVYEGVKKVYVGQDLSRITYIKFEYVKEGGEVVTREYGTVTQEDPREFVIEYPDEHITAVEGSHNKVALIATEVITSLVFKTSKGRTSPTFGPNLFGVVNGTKFKFEDEGKKIVGFHGRSDKAVDALGVYLELDSLTTPFPIYKLEAQGGKEGSVWDDGCFDGVRTVRVGQDDCRITYLEFEYVKGARFETRHHGVKGETQSEVFSTRSYIHDWPNNFQKRSYSSLSLLGPRGQSLSGRGSALLRNSKLFGGGANSLRRGSLDPDEFYVEIKFKFEDEGKKIVGFHGRSDNAIDALGVYFALESLTTPFPIYKLEAQGGQVGSVWDDGCFQGVRTVRVCQDDCRVTYLEFEYVKALRLETRHHGFVVNFPSEDIKLVEVTYDNPKIFRNTVITSLKFETTTGRTLTFGYDAGKKFVLGGSRLVGFHGKEGEAIDALGAYFEHIPIPIPPPEGIAFVKFVYIKGNGLVTGDDHGKITSLGAEEIVLENGEYLTGIEDYYRPIPGAPFGKTVLSSRRTKGRHLCMNWIPVRNTRLRRKATRSQGSMDELPPMLFTVWKPFPGQSS
ncbi:hypothetical protein F2Q69_00017638 [Brassica cretica]|uniref:Jacalin-type lectin domain-containing protein n=1 Tax=Brassica cretica TaxID=69181 RepID=A0A8S9QQV1_BRACR|nr:hypothetical protein F2Q69_00017638 [Brassica cretica]